MTSEDRGGTPEEVPLLLAVRETGNVEMSHHEASSFWSLVSCVLSTNRFLRLCPTCKCSLFVLNYWILIWLLWSSPVDHYDNWKPTTFQILKISSLGFSLLIVFWKTTFYLLKLRHINTCLRKTISAFYKVALFREFEVFLPWRKGQKWIATIPGAPWLTHSTIHFK